jgi:stage II sporulation protein D (peptidoglycan lytic transglycosylase)
VRGCVGCAMWLAMLFACVGEGAAQTFDGGGRDVSVALFSTRNLHAVTVAPLSPGARIARCARCAHAPLTAPLQLAAPMEIFAGGTLSVTDNASGETRAATGLWHLRASGPDRAIDVVVTIPSERYVAAVLNAEAAPDEPTQSLRAMAILARTYALNGSHFTAQRGHLAAELCDSTECQAMRLAVVPPAIEDAVQATAGETLWFGGRRAEVFFSQSCGGLTEDAGAVWPRLSGIPYLRSHSDPYCLRRDTAAWHAEVPLTKIAEIAQAEGWHLPAKIASAQVTSRSASHRALRIAFSSESGGSSAVSASALRFGIGRALGWNLVRSDAYEIRVRNGALVFDGHGYGHGVGLCQVGAAEMAAGGKSARDILGFYFPGTAVRITADDGGWQEFHSDRITVRSARPLPAQQAAALAQIWSEAQRRFPPRRAISPEIVFAPTSEVFRQMTTQPGWALASTRDSTITLQPEAVLRAQGRSERETLLHELLHVLVEDEASAHAPLWLREGLVEVLGGERGGDSHSMFDSAMEGELTRAETQQASRRAHLAAAARVRALVGRYGMPEVRGWLSSGVPVGLE